MVDPRRRAKRPTPQQPCYFYSSCVRSLAGSYDTLLPFSGCVAALTKVLKFWLAGVRSSLRSSFCVHTHSYTATLAGATAVCRWCYSQRIFAVKRDYYRQLAEATNLAKHRAIYNPYYSPLSYWHIECLNKALTLALFLGIAILIPPPPLLLLPHAQWTSSSVFPQNEIDDIGIVRNCG